MFTEKVSAICVARSLVQLSQAIVHINDEDGRHRQTNRFEVHERHV